MSILKRPGWVSKTKVIREGRISGNPLRRRIESMYDKMSLSAEGGCSFYTVTKIMNTLAIQNPGIEPDGYTDDQIKMAVRHTAALHRKDFIPQERSDTQENISQFSKAEEEDTSFEGYKEKFSNLTFILKKRLSLKTSSTCFYKAEHMTESGKRQVINIATSKDFGEEMFINDIQNASDIISFTIDENNQRVVDQIPKERSKVIASEQDAEMSITDIKKHFADLNFEIKSKYDPRGSYVYKAVRFSPQSKNQQVITLIVTQDHGKMMNVRELVSSEMLGFIVEENGIRIIDVIYNHIEITNDLEKGEEPDLSEDEINDLYRDFGKMTDPGDYKHTKIEWTPKKKGKYEDDEEPSDEDLEEIDEDEKEVEEPKQDPQPPKKKGKYDDDDDEIKEAVKLSPQAQNRILQENRIKNKQRYQLIEEKYNRR